MKKWGIVGIGKLGTAIVSNLKEQNIGVYHSNKQKAEEFSKCYPHTLPLKKTELEKVDYLILCLPADQIPSFLNETNDLLQNVVIINMATALQTSDLHLQFPLLKIVGMKFIGHSQALKVYRNGLFVTDKQRAGHEIVSFFENIGKVLDGDDSFVLKVNKAATTYAVQAAVQIEKDLQKNGYEDIVLHAALQSMVPEVIRSYVEGTLGHFAQHIANEIKQND